MYTPGSTSPPLDRAQKKSTRFSRAASTRSHNQSQSFILPTNIPNTSQIVADQGSLPDVQIRYSIPADEKQIVASLRTLQRDLNEAIQTINSLTRERDEALLELRLLRATSKKQTTQTKKTTRVSSHEQEEELFDLSRSIESPQRSPARRVSTKRFGADPKQNGRTTVSDDARVLSPLDINGPLSPSPNKRQAGGTPGNQQNKSQVNRKPTINDTENSVLEDPTAASNTSRRRRHLDLDENMTSAYILPDITVGQSQAQAQAQAHGVSKGAQTVLHRHDPEHVHNCEVCQRLTGSKKTKHVTHASVKSTHITATSSKQASKAAKDQDFTAQITQLMKSAMLDDPTIRPKISPWQALANVKKLLTDQFEEAKRKHGIAWETYDGIEAPLSSKRHAAISEELFYWSRKMEECRVNLDQLRDVEEGMRGEDED
jgi:hypothetical protein